MPRVKRGVIHKKRVKNVLKSTKGFKWGRKSKIKLAKTARFKAGVYAYRDRRAKKRDIRSQWIININALLRTYNLSYSKFIGLLKKKNILLDRKILATLAEQHPAVFGKIVEAVR